MDAITSNTQSGSPTDVPFGQSGSTAFEQRMLREWGKAVDFRNGVVSLGQQPLDDAGNRYLKRATDLFISIVIIVFVLSWLTPLIAFLIKLSSRGPVFFLQQRNKRNGEMFTCLKFRSMIVNAEADLQPAAENDPRITRLGRFLRRYYIDELPQFINVLLGDMSVVGPRPHMVSDNLRHSKIIDHYHYRHKVKPGITGLSQVMGYVGATDTDPRRMQDRVRLDLLYWRHWSFRLDLLILVRTFFRIPILRPGRS
jgi:putative colanic acid biosysnthesis UDP-glucose lipid carrier transferase